MDFSFNVTTKNMLFCAIESVMMIYVTILHCVECVPYYLVSHRLVGTPRKVEFTN